MNDRPSWIFGRSYEKPTPEQQALFDRGRKAYLAWHVLEGLGRDVIDMDLNRQSDRSIITMIQNMKRGPTTLQDRHAIVDTFATLKADFDAVPKDIIADPQLWDYAKSTVNASWYFARRSRGEKLNPIEYLANASGIENPIDEFVPEKELNAQKEVCVSILTGTSFRNLDPDSAALELSHACEQSRLRLQRFTGKDFDFPFVIEPANVEAPWRAWTSTHPKVRGFLLRQNLYWPWPEGKPEELGWHERHHVDRMGRRQEEIVRGHLDRFFGIAVVHGPESSVEEGWAQTSTLFIPGAYDSLTPQGKFQVRSSILKSMVYLNAKLLMCSGEATREEASAYVKEHIPWEDETELQQQLTWITDDKLNEIYKPQYGIGAHHFLKYAALLSDRGKKALMERLYAKPYMITQTDELAMQLLEDNRNAADPKKNSIHLIQQHNLLKQQDNTN